MFRNDTYNHDNFIISPVMILKMPPLKGLHVNKDWNYAKHKINVVRKLQIVLKVTMHI